MNNSKPKITPALPRGMRDLLPDQLAVRYKVIETLRKVFELYGFQPLETPAMERLEILSGKGGEESDKLSFLVMKRGAEFQRALDKILEASKAGELNYTEAQKELADMGLRYDLTVPLARVVAMNQGKLAMPFKRYQIAPVWRAERPQHGRYREFTQCDVDIVGTDSPVADAEIISIYLDGFKEIGEAFGIKNWQTKVVVNHRGVLSQLSRAVGNAPGQDVEFCRVLDKLDKIGADEVIAEMNRKELKIDGLASLDLDIRGNDSGIEYFVRDQLGDQFDPEPFSRLKMIDKYCGSSNRVETNFKLARGLDYYTGVVFEVIEFGGMMGSLGGGGRYDGLVSAFSKQSLPAVGASFGLERIVDRLEFEYITAKKNPETAVIYLRDQGHQTQFTYIPNYLRENGLSCFNSYRHGEGRSSQLKSANNSGKQFVIIIEQTLTPNYELEPLLIKRLSDGEERRLTLQQIVEWIKESGK